MINIVYILDPKKNIFVTYTLDWNRVYNILERDIIESLMRSEGGDQRRSHVNKVLGVVFVPWRNNSYNAMNMANWQYHDQYAMPTTIDHIHQNMGENDNLTNLVCWYIY